MKSLVNYLTESYTIHNWKELEEALKSFIDDSNLEPYSDEERDIDDILSSLEEWLIEIYDVPENSVKSLLKKFDSDIRKWFFDEGIVDEA